MQRLEARLPITTAAPTAVVMQRWEGRGAYCTDLAFAVIVAPVGRCCAQRVTTDCPALGRTLLLGMGVRVLPHMG